MTTTTTPNKTRKPRTPEQIAARKLKSKERRDAKKQTIPVTPENRDLLQKGFEQLLATFEKGDLTYRAASSLITLTTRKQQSPEQLREKLEREQRKLARLQAALDALNN